MCVGAGCVCVCACVWFVQHVWCTSIAHGEVLTKRKSAQPPTQVRSVCISLLGREIAAATKGV